MTHLTFVWHYELWCILIIWFRLAFLHTSKPMGHHFFAIRCSPTCPIDIRICLPFHRGPSGHFALRPVHFWAGRPRLVRHPCAGAVLRRRGQSDGGTDCRRSDHAKGPRARERVCRTSPPFQCGIWWSETGEIEYFDVFNTFLLLYLLRAFPL